MGGGGVSINNRTHKCKNGIKTQTDGTEKKTVSESKENTKHKQHHMPSVKKSRKLQHGTTWLHRPG